MNTAVEVNPILKMTNDAFDDVFGESVSPAVQDAELSKLRAITTNLREMAPHMKALGDALPARKQTMDDKLDEVIALSRKIATLCRELKYTVPSDFDNALEESKLDAEGIVTNIAAIRMHLADEPYVPCNCGGVCDSCVAARSDEHYDRHADGQLCDEA